MIRKLAILALAGCAAAASAFAVLHHSRRKEAQQHKADLAAWEGDGGKSAPSAEHPAQAS